MKQWAFFISSGNTDADFIKGSIEEIIGTKPVAYFGLNAKEIKDGKIYNEKISNFIEAIKRNFKA